ncbi:hypothetical protein B0A49_10092 [Cryomyces minteri]|uniref:Uncharacterized protein n=1 Tax=Cryomyces minteri TaxID=331657 RepID=A0A4U0WHX9_9PEZI|nr:hypothetical protein B0A49_10092 [Cryomyces minteri]
MSFRMQWMMEQRFPKPGTIAKPPSTLVKLQSLSFDVEFHFARPRFELETAWINQALSLRDKYWYSDKDDKGESKPVEDTIQTPEPLKIAPLPPVIRFHDDKREYLSRILGCHTYEYEAERGSHYRHYDGVHQCIVIPDDAGSRSYLLLIHIEVPSGHNCESTVSPNARIDNISLLEINDNVSIVVKDSVIMQAGALIPHGIKHNIIPHHIFSLRVIFDDKHLQALGPAVRLARSIVGSEDVTTYQGSPA